MTHEEKLLREALEGTGVEVELQHAHSGDGPPWRIGLRTPGGRLIVLEAASDLWGYSMGIDVLEADTEERRQRYAERVQVNEGR